MAADLITGAFKFVARPMFLHILSTIALIYIVNLCKYRTNIALFKIFRRIVRSNKPNLAYIERDRFIKPV